MDIAGFRPGSRGALVIGAILAMTSGLAGCSHSDQTRKQLGAFEQITARRTDQDRLEERLSVLEIHARRKPEAASRSKVTHVAPNDPADAESPDVESAPVDIASLRPLIRGTGDRFIKMLDPETQVNLDSNNASASCVARRGY